jgi:hypothetical protein
LFRLYDTANPPACLLQNQQTDGRIDKERMEDSCLFGQGPEWAACRCGGFCLGYDQRQVPFFFVVFAGLRIGNEYFPAFRNITQHDEMAAAGKIAFAHQRDDKAAALQRTADFPGAGNALNLQPVVARAVRDETVEAAAACDAVAVF